MNYTKKLLKRLRSVRSTMLGTADEDIFDACQEAAIEIEDLNKKINFLKSENRLLIKQRTIS